MKNYYENPVSFRIYQQNVSGKIDYQESINESCTVCMPTGTGKTKVLIDRAIKKVCEGQTVAIIVPKIELIFNVEKDLKELAPKIYKFLYSPISSKLKYKPGKRLYVGTYGSFIKRYAKMPRKPEYFIHDEAHHCKAKTWETIATLKGFHVAFTATPLRLDGKSLKDLFPGFVDSGYDMSWFIDQGYLNNFEVKSTFTVEFEKQKGIDNLKYQSEKLDKRELLGDAVEEWKKHAYGRKTITFCTTIEHCYHTLEAYKDAGIPATVIDSKMTFEQRKEALEGFASGRYMVIINVAILTEGVDVPDAECCQLLRFTNSIPLYFQMVGRVLRPSKNRSIILDHAGNVEHHMTPDCPIDWRELYYAQVDMKDVSAFNPYVLCQCCEHELMKKSEKPDFLITKICPKCGFENLIEPPKKRDPVSTKQGELFDFKMSRQEQIMYKIYSSDIPHQNKVAQILKCLKHPNFTEGDVRSGLNILYYDHPDREMIVNRYMELGRKKVLEAKVKKQLR